MIAQRGGTGEALSTQGFEAAIARGMRAQLNVESLLTGLLYVDLDLHPNAPLNLALVPGSGDLREIPTVPTTMEAIQKQATEAIAKLDQIDFNALVLSITSAANSINQLTGSPDLKATLASLKQTVPNLNQAVSSLRTALDNANATNCAAGSQSPEELGRSERHDERYARGVARSEIQPRARFARCR